MRFRFSLPPLPKRAMTAESTINERPAAENPGDFSPRDPEARGMTCYSP